MIDVCVTTAGCVVSVFVPMILAEKVCSPFICAAQKKGRWYVIRCTANSQGTVRRRLVIFKLSGMRPFRFVNLVAIYS